MPDPSRPRSRDADLVAQFLAGNPDGFQELIKSYSKPVFNFIRRFLGDPEASKDVFQETLLAAMRALPTYDSTRPFLPWLLGIAVNRCREEKRRKKHFSIEDMASQGAAIAENLPSPDRLAADREMAAKVARAVSTLDDAHRAVFLLRIYEGFTYAQIGEILNISEGTAKSRMHYAVYNVRKLMKEKPR
ncbi:MAG: RNA polymerase sigma factor [Planctomycetota bacterium]|jgi:RNA polymerase sigma-70 factor (ECF subfamily)